MKIKRFLAQLLSAVLCMTLAGCYGNESDAKKNIAVIVKAVDSDFWHSVKNGVNSAAIEYNVSVSFEGPENEEDYKAQNDMIKKAVSDGADVILLSAIDYVKSNDAVEYAAEGLDSERQRSNVEKEKILYVAAEDAALDCCADRHALIGVDSLEGLLADEVLDCILNGGDTGRAADEKHLVYLIYGKSRVGENSLRRLHGSLNEVCGESVELRTAERRLEVLRSGCIRRDEREVDIGGGHAGKLDLRLLCGFLKSLPSCPCAGLFRHSPP